MRIPGFSKWGWGLAVVALAAAALGLRLSGNDWPNLHPDRHTLGRWMTWTLDHPHIRDRAYAGGFFTLFRPVHLAAVLTSPSFREARAVDIRSPDKSERILHLVLLARGFNAWLGALTVLTVFALVRRVTGSGPAAFAGAWLAAFSPFLVEHAHYEETDIAMAFTLTLALWLCARARDIPGRGPMLSAAAVAGFAGGTKFPLLTLLPVLLWVAAFPASGESLSPVGRIRRGLLGLLAFAAGFLLAHPILLLEPMLFLRHARIASGQLMEETRQVLGAAAALPGARRAYQWRWLGIYLGAGEGWWVLPVCLLGLPALLSRRRRVYAPVTLLFPVVLTAQLVFLAPWIRVQETFAYLPALACLFGGAWAGPWAEGRGRAARALRWGVALLLLAAGAQLLHAGLLRVSLFRWKDTRFMAQTWLQRHYPRERLLGLDLYTKSVEGRSLPVERVAPAERIEEGGIETLREEGFSYLLRNASTPGKGLFDPFTGRLFPAQQANRTAFERAAEIIRIWSPAPPESPATFAFVNAELQLYGLQPTAPGVELRVPLNRPVYYGEDHDDTFFPVGHAYGSAHEIVLLRKRKTIAVGGPDSDPPPVFLVLSAPDGPLRLTVRGYGRSRIVEIPTGGFRVLALDRPWWMPRFDKFERIEFVKTAPFDRLGRVRVCFDVTEAALTLLEAGQPGLAVEWLNRRPPGGSMEKVLRALIARQVNPEAVEYDGELKAAAESLDYAAAMRPENVRINGMPGLYYNDFARVHLPSDPVQAVPGTIVFRAPLLLPRGRWRVRLEWYQQDVSREWAAEDIKAQDGDGKTIRRVQLSRIEPDRMAASFDWEAKETTDASFHLTVPYAGSLKPRSVTVTWTLADRLRALAADLAPAAP